MVIFAPILLSISIYFFAIQVYLIGFLLLAMSLLFLFLYSTSKRDNQVDRAKAFILEDVDTLISEVLIFTKNSIKNKKVKKTQIGNRVILETNFNQQGIKVEFEEINKAQFIYQFESLKYGKDVFSYADYQTIFGKYDINSLIESHIMNEIDQKKEVYSNKIEELKKANDQIGFYETFKDARELEKITKRANKIKEHYRSQFRTTL